MTERIGIDFGAANTVVARWDERAGRGEPVPLDGIDLIRDGAGDVSQRVIPSLIAFSCDSDIRWVGAQVTMRPDLLADPTAAVFASSKAAVTGRAVDIPRNVGGRRISNRAAATAFLGDVTALAVLAVGTDDLEIVATAPVEAFDAYRDWLVREVSAGLGGTRLRVVDEATAAAVGYQARMNPGEVFCVFDFGASTLDVSVVRISEPDDAGQAGAGVRAIAKAGLDLGGNHIDALLAEWAAREAKVPDGDPVTWNRVFRQLLASAEAAKVALTSSDRAAVEAADPVTGKRYRARVTRAEFEQLLRDSDVLSRIGRGLRRALDDAAVRGYRSDDIAGVFLVGGSALIPVVRDVIRMQFDPGILHAERPLEAVAAGAAAIAGGQELHDHIQHDYAIRHVTKAGYEFETLVTAGTAYPTPEPVRSLTIKAVHPGQRRLGIPIYELAHATAQQGSGEWEIVYDADGGARRVAVSPQQLAEQAMRWLNEDSPTFLEANPPGRAGADRFRLDFRVDAGKLLTVSAFDLVKKVWVLDRQPVVRLA